MNRRQKIIISVTGIFIVLLILIGLTYGYFLTRITGNPNNQSISVTTAKLELVYGDNSAEILTGTGALTPSTDLTSAGAIGTKTFTVTNNGNDSSYVVIIDNVSVTKVSDGSSTSFVSNDFRYTLSCTNSDGTKCNEVNDLTIFPIKGGILVSNDIKEDDVHTYTLTMWYIDTGIDQSDDMGKSYQARVNIADVNQMENPFKTGVSATDNVNLAYNIIKNAKENKNGTKLLNVADTPVAENIARYRTETTYTGTSWDYGTYYALYDMCDAPSATTCTSDMIGSYIGENCGSEPTAIITGCDASGKPIVSDYIDEYESSLAIEQDDLGTSYYYRGNVIDNYVTFANMCWRIVRINGDGTTKLILEDQDEPCSEIMNGNWGIPTTTGGTSYTGNYGYEYNNVTNTSGATSSGKNYVMNYLEPVTNADKSMARAFYDFQKDKLKDYTGKLKSGDWCLADSAYTRTGDSAPYEYTSLLSQNKNVKDLQYEEKTFYYDSYVRLYGDGTNGYQPTLKCTGTKMDSFKSVTYNGTEIIKEVPMYVSTITADEMVYAGGKVYSQNSNFYLLNENFKNRNLDYYYFWSLSPDSFDSANHYAFDMYNGGGMRSDYVSGSDYGAFRPAVSLASSVSITSGEGTLKQPYVIG